VVEILVKRPCVTSGLGKYAGELGMRRDADLVSGGD
jgi:hypothetical protein